MEFSIKKIEKIISELPQMTNVSILAVQVNSSKRTGMDYVSEQILLDKKENVAKYLNDIEQYYRKKDYTCVEPYTGDKNAEAIYFLSTEDPLIQEEYTRLLNATVTSDCENEDIIFSGNASMVKGELIDVNNEPHFISLLTYKKPYTVLNHKYTLDKPNIQFGKQKTFKPITEKVVNLQIYFDILVYDETLFFFNLNGEKFFSLERSFKKICEDCIQNVVNSNIIKNVDYFAENAKKGHNPRRFLLFDSEALSDLMNLEKRRDIASSFHIKLADDKFLIESNEDCTKLIKLLCKKGMLDPFSENAMEVSSAKKWEDN